MKKLFIIIGVFIISLTLSACQEKVVLFDINFNSNGGTEVDEISTDGSSTIVLPENPTKDGFIFDGWYWDDYIFEEPLTTNSLLDAPLSSDMTVYAKWAELDASLNTRLTSIYNLTVEAEAFDGTYEEWLETIRGPQGIPGADGLEVLFQVAEGYIQWQYTGDSTWTNLIELTTLTGAAGADGVDGTDGLSAYEIYVFENPDYLGTQDEWINDLINGNLYEYETWTVTFDTNGGDNIDPLIGIEHGSYINLPISTKEGFGFKGWFTGTTINDGQFTNLTPVTQNFTLIARWETNQYTISYAIVTDEYNSDVAIVLNEGETITNVSLGNQHSSAITSEGRIFTWGWNDHGQLGDGTTTDKHSPIEITNQFTLNEGETITSIALGVYHSSALTSEGRVFTWGGNGYGQLGDGTTTDRYIPTEITSNFNLNVGEIITNISLGHSHSSAITSEGRVFTWGWNNEGQIGDGTTTDRYIPTEITNQFILNEGETITNIDLRIYHSSAITSEGRIFMWGLNSYGQLGDGTTTDKHSPIEITNQFTLNEGETITNVSLGFVHSLAITSEGKIFTWGRNQRGELGDGTATYRYTPTEITYQFTLNEGETITNGSLGYQYSSAITSEGRVFTWGINDYGEIGDGTTTHRYTPTEITNQFTLNEGETITNVSIGYRHSSAITSEGRIFTWGWNINGQLGDGTITDRYIPTEIGTYELTIIYIDNVDFESDIEEYIPLLSGYTFSGWYSDIDMVTEYVFETMPAEDLTLYAKWTSNEQISFDIDVLLAESLLQGFYNDVFDGSMTIAEVCAKYMDTPFVMIVTEEQCNSEEEGLVNVLSAPITTYVVSETTLLDGVYTSTVTFNDVFIITVSYDFIGYEYDDIYYLNLLDDPFQMEMGTAGLTEAEALVFVEQYYADLIDLTIDDTTFCSMYMHIIMGTQFFATEADCIANRQLAQTFISYEVISVVFREGTNGNPDLFEATILRDNIVTVYAIFLFVDKDPIGIVASPEVTSLG